MPTQIEEIAAVSAAEFAARIRERARPLVLRGQNAGWPAVRIARESPVALFESLRQLDGAQALSTMIAPPEIRGRFFYTQSMDGVNFERRPQTLGESIDQILAYAGTPRAPTVYVGAVPLGPRARFAAENRAGLLDATVTPRIWLSNAATVQTHLDMSENLACVVCGTRRFTLFPPEAIGDLYVGPLDFTLAGQPVSLVRLDDPDFERYPRFERALEVACYADLEPGDALYIPYMWWHHVEMRGPLNVLVNYWWNNATAWKGSPFDCLVHAIAGLRALPAPERAAWHAVFSHYIFNEEDATAHIPSASRGVLAPLDANNAEQIRQWLLRSLARG